MLLNARGFQDQFGQIANAVAGLVGCNPFRHLAHRAQEHIQCRVFAAPVNSASMVKGMPAIRATSPLVLAALVAPLPVPLPAIRDLLSLPDLPDQSCHAADAIARTQVGDVEARIARLTAPRTEFQRMVAPCAGGSTRDPPSISRPQMPKSPAALRSGHGCGLTAAMPWLIPGMLALAPFAWLLTRADVGFSGRVCAAYGGADMAASLGGSGSSRA